MRKALGWLLILHGLAHAGPGMWVSDRAPVWLGTVLWALAAAGLTGAGFGLWRVQPFRPRARLLATTGVVSSLLLLPFVGHWLILPGLLVDLGAAAVILRWPGWQSLGMPAPVRHPWRASIAAILATVVFAYLTGVILLRPWYQSWGATPRDLAATLPGDSLVPDARYRIDHVISINAPAERVWPWLLQIGQDRAGFYSYSWLENLIGADIHNSDRIVPDWQEREAGDLVRAVPADWFGGRFGREIGWRVLEVVPERALVLQGWGSFVLDPVDSTTTRFHVRTRGDGRPAFWGVFLAPVGLLVFEPAHFMMERGMLRGVRARAEGG